MHYTISELAIIPDVMQERDFSYHRVVWHDVNHDGNIDAVAARFKLPTLGDPILQLLWLENPGTGPSEGWTQHLIFEGGPDVHFRLTSFLVGNQNFTVLAAAEFFSERLSIYYAADGSDSFLSDPSTASFFL
jgi:hypothetical protein